MSLFDVPVWGGIHPRLPLMLWVQILNGTRHTTEHSLSFAIDLLVKAA
jgi:hypothetical protein